VPRTRPSSQRRISDQQKRCLKLPLGGQLKRDWARLIQGGAWESILIGGSSPTPRWQAVHITQDFLLCAWRNRARLSATTLGLPRRAFVSSNWPMRELYCEKEVCISFSMPPSRFAHCDPIYRDRMIHILACPSKPCRNRIKGGWRSGRSVTSLDCSSVGVAISVFSPMVLRLGWVDNVAA
jgi:hypothetical protein